MKAYRPPRNASDHLQPPYQTGSGAPGPPPRGSVRSPPCRGRWLSAEVVRVRGDVGSPLPGDVHLGEDRRDGAHGLTGSAVDTDLGINIELRRVVETRLARQWMDAIDRAHLDTGLVLRADARLTNYV